MWLEDFLEKLTNKKERVGGTVVINIPSKLYYKELALYTASSLIENAIGKCEFKVFENGKPIKNEDYYILNVAPNLNENASLFWHKVVRRMIRNPKGALVVEIRGKLHCALDFSIKEERPILGNLYDGVVLEGGLQLAKTFRAEEVYLFRMEDQNVKVLIDGMYEEYGSLLQTAVRTFKDTNGRKFKFKVDGVKQGDEEFDKEFKEIISKDIKTYMENEYATYVEYEGEELEEQTEKQRVNADDVVKIRKDMFEMVGQALKIPQALMTGNVTSVKDVADVFLTFSVDPVADAITEVLNKRATLKEFVKGNFYKVDTGNIKHRDIFDLAPNIEKLIGSSALNIDELREEIDREPLNTEWSRTFFMTKNNAKTEDVVNGLVEGGEKDGNKNT